MKFYKGKGLIKINSCEEKQVEYEVQVTSKDSNIIGVEARILSPQDAIEKVYRITGTLTLEDGEELDFLGAENGKLTPINFGLAMKNF